MLYDPKQLSDPFPDMPTMPISILYHKALPEKVTYLFSEECLYCRQRKESKNVG